MLEERLRRRRVASVLTSAFVAGALLGLFDALSALRSGHGRVGVLSLAVAAGCVSVVGLGLGVLPAAFSLLLGKRALREVFPRLSRLGARDLNAPREPVLRGHALAVSLLIVLAVLLPGLWLVDVGLEVVQDAGMQRALRVVAAGGLVTFGALAALLAYPPLVRLFGRIDGRRGLPLPASAFGRYCVYVLVPSLAPAWLLLRSYGDDLAWMLWPLGALLFVELQVFVYLAGRALRDAGRAATAGAAVVFVALAVVAQPVLFQWSPEAKFAASRGAYVPLSVWILRSATDFDRDGFSSLYAGGDCAPFDPARHPAAFDEPGNGEDENCDGADASRERKTAASVRRVAFEVPADQVRPYNIVWVVIDAVRPDSMGLYGAKFRNTPFLEELAETSLVFENAYAPSSTTHLSVASMLLGKNVESMKWRYKKDKSRLEPVEAERTFAERLRDLGYRNVAVVSPFMAQRSGMLRGLRIAETSKKLFGHYSPSATATAIDELHPRKGKREPFFLFVYYPDPHAPYDAHPGGFPQFGKSERERYAGEIGYVDHHLGELFSHLRLHAEIWDRTIVVVTSDHGEEFGEHGQTRHGKTCYEESVHVPLVLRVPGYAARRVSRRVALVDIVPTLLGLVGGKAAEGELDGQSLLIPDGEAGASVPVFCAITNQGGVLTNKPFFQRSVRYGSRVLVQDALSGRYELYDAERDRAEKVNLAGDAKESAAMEELKALLTANARGNFEERRLK